MYRKLSTGLGTLMILASLAWYSVGHAQNAAMGREEPHMNAALGHLQEAKAELEKAAANKGGHRDKAIQLVDEAIQQVRAGEAYYEQHHGK